LKLIAQDWMTPAALAELLGVDVATLANWRSRDAGPRYLKVGKNIFYPECDVESWLQSVRCGEEPTEHATKKSERRLVLASLDQRTGVHRQHRTAGHKTSRERRQEMRGREEAGID